MYTTASLQTLFEGQCEWWKVLGDWGGVPLFWGWQTPVPSLGPSAQSLTPQGCCSPICSHWLLLEVLGHIISSSFVADVIPVFFVMWSLWWGGGIQGDFKSSITTSTQQFAETHDFKKFFPASLYDSSRWEIIPSVFHSVFPRVCSCCLTVPLLILFCLPRLLKSHWGFNLDYFRSCVHHCFNSVLVGANRLHDSDVWVLKIII